LLKNRCLKQLPPLSYEKLAEGFHFDNTLHTNNNQETLEEFELCLNNYTVEEAVRMQKTNTCELYQIKTNALNF